MQQKLMKTKKTESPFIAGDQSWKLIFLEEKRNKYTRMLRRFWNSIAEKQYIFGDIVQKINQRG